MWLPFSLLAEDAAAYLCIYCSNKLYILTNRYSVYWYMAAIMHRWWWMT